MDIILSLEKEMAYLKGFLKGKEFEQSLLALQFAKAKHDGQFRKSGEPYIMHPVRVCTTAMSLGVYEDDVLAVCLLHDVPEDCKVSMSNLESMGFNVNVRYGVDLITKKAGQTTEDYYRELMWSNAPWTLLPKLFDRGHNISTMSGAFSEDKIRQYIEETKEYVFPLFAHAKKVIPKYSEQLFVMKYNLESIIKVYESFLTKPCEKVNDIEGSV